MAEEEKKKVATKEKKRRKGMKDYKKEFMPPVELKTDPDYPVNFPELVVAGHKVTPREADIFCTYHTSHNIDLVCRKFGMTRQNLWVITQKPWWIAWNINQLKEWINISRNHWLSQADRLIEKQIDFIENPHDYPQGYGQALAKMADTLFRMSPEGLRPTLVSKFEIETQTKVVGSVDINVNITSDQIKKLTPEQIDEWNRTGVMPQQLTEVVGDITEDAVDAEFEEIEIDDEEDKEENNS